MRVRVRAPRDAEPSAGGGSAVQPRIFGAHGKGRRARLSKVPLPFKKHPPPVMAERSARPSLFLWGRRRLLVGAPIYSFFRMGGRRLFAPQRGVEKRRRSLLNILIILGSVAHFSKNLSIALKIKPLQLHTRKMFLQSEGGFLQSEGGSLCRKIAKQKAAPWVSGVAWLVSSSPSSFRVGRRVG